MDLVYLMTHGGPGNTTEVVGITLFRKAFEGFTMGWSAALAVIALLIAIAFTSIYLYILSLSRAEKEASLMQRDWRRSVYHVVLWVVVARLLPARLLDHPGRLQDQG